MGAVVVHLGGSQPIPKEDFVAKYANATWLFVTTSLPYPYTCGWGCPKSVVSFLKYHQHSRKKQQLISVFPADFFLAWWHRNFLLGGIPNISLDIQTPVEKVFGPPKYTQNIFSGGIWMSRVYWINCLFWQWFGRDFLCTMEPFQKNAMRGRCSEAHWCVVETFKNPPKIIPNLKAKYIYLERK